ncbi:MAG: C25 family cysteine peptidase, partial [Candidatus Electryonea clarkiae]|nr:C25 family cysteine peptidase [Candidatus Electryonea clarkiae]
MKTLRFFAVLSCFLLIAGTTLARNFTAGKDLPMQITERIITSNGMSLSLEIVDPEWKQAGLSEDNIVVAQLGPLSGHLESEGFPVVPVTSRMFRIPPRSGVTVDVIKAEYETYTDIEYAAYFGGDEIDDYRPSRKIEDTWYPGTLAEVTDPIIYHDFRVCNLAAYPVQVNTARREVRVYSKIDVDIRYEGVDNRCALDQMPTAISSTFLPWYREFLDWDENELDEYTLYRGGVQVVLQNEEELWEALQPWIEWKLQKGWELEFLADDDCTWNYSGIRNELRDRYEDNKFDYIIIIGDVNGLFPTPTGDPGYSDNYYTLMDDDDLYQDVVIGRISVQDLEDVRNYGNKVILYERDPYMEETDWYLRGAGLSVWDYAGTSTIQVVQYGKREMLRIGYEEVNIHVSRFRDANSTIMRMNEGISHYIFRAGIGSGIQANSIRALTNDRMLFPAPEYTCGTGTMSQTECICEAWMRAGTFNNPRGAIGGLGLATNSSHCSFNNMLAVGSAYAALNLRHPALGMMMWGARASLWDAFHPDWVQGGYTYERSAKEANLFGDPTCWIWTAIPQELVVDAEETVPVGRNSYSVSVVDTNDNPVVDAWVTLYKVDDNEEIIVRGTTGEDGTVILNAPFRYSGDAMLTVTAQNFIPNRIEVELVEPNARIGYTEITFQDNGNNGTEGNNNGIPEAGETVGLVINARNFGNANQANITVTAETEDDWVVSLTGEVTIDAINAGQDQEGEGLILVEIDPEAQHDWLIHLDLEFESDAGTYDDEFAIKVNAPHFFFVQVEGAGDIEPGDTEDITISIINLGGSDASASEGYLTFLHPFGGVADPTGEFDPVDVGEEADAEFTITAHPESFPGFSVPAKLVITTEDGCIDTVWFSITLGTRSSSDPTGPDNYGYYAFDHTDTDYELYPEYDWIEINPEVEDNDFEGEATEIDDRGDDQDTCAVFALPFEVQHYGEVFDSITISSNGFAAFGSWHDMDYALRNGPFPGPYGAPNMIAPYWDERAQGEIFHYYDEENNRYIIEWFETKGRTGSSTYGHDCTFEVIIYDQSGHHSTRTGDAEILFQYDEMDRHLGYGRCMPWWTTGISDGTYNDGLMYYYYNRPWPGARFTNDCDEGLAILFTTNVMFIIGSLEGTVTDAATGEPMENVEVSTGNNMYLSETDSAGHYFLEEVGIGEYELEFIYDCFIDTVISHITVFEDDTTFVNIALTHSELDLNSYEIDVELEPGTEEIVEITISNDGNGVLEYEAEIYLVDPRVRPDQTDTPWNNLYAFDLSPDESRYFGLTFVNREFYVSGADNLDPVGPNKIYKYDDQGRDLLTTYNQPVPEDRRSASGMRGLTWDGDYLYGVDNERLYQMEILPDTLNAVESWEVPLEQAHYLEWDPVNDLFWMGDYNSDIYGVDRNGDIAAQFEREFIPRGATWNPYDELGRNLYLFSQFSSRSNIHVVRMNPETGDCDTVHTIPYPAGRWALSGIDFSQSWNPLVHVFSALINQTEESYVQVWYFNDNETFFSINNPNGTLAGGGESIIEFMSNSTGLPFGSYSFFVGFDNNACEDENN